MLSDGPDPDSDPVGYAEAQILPLGQIHTSDAQLRTAIGKLASEVVLRVPVGPSPSDRIDAVAAS